MSPLCVSICKQILNIFIAYACACRSLTDSEDAQDYLLYSEKNSNSSFAPLDDAIVYQPDTAPLWASDACTSAAIFFFTYNTCKSPMNITYTVRCNPPHLSDTEYNRLLGGKTYYYFALKYLCANKCTRRVNMAPAICSEILTRKSQAN